MSLRVGSFHCTLNVNVPASLCLSGSWSQSTLEAVDGENRTWMSELDTSLPGVLGQPLAFCGDWEAGGPSEGLAP